MGNGDSKQMLIIKIALGIVLAFFIIGILLQPSSIIITWFLIFGALLLFYALLSFIIDKLDEPARKRHYEESWKRFNEQQNKK